MDAYILIGNRNTRKSSVVRSLTGGFNRSLRDIQLAPAGPTVQIYARVGALQESKTTAAMFELEVSRKRCTATVFCLLPSANPLEPLQYPDAKSYIDHFTGIGWRIKRIAVLGQNAGGIRSPLLRQFPQAPTEPINITAQQVRNHFLWC